MRSGSVHRLSLQPQRAYWSEFLFKEKKVPVLVSANGIRQNIIKARTIFDALELKWFNKRIGPSVPLVVVSRASLGLNGGYVTLRDGIRLCRNLGDEDLWRAIHAFGTRNGVVLDGIRVASFPNLKQRFGDLIQIDRFEDLPLAVNITMAFSANGLKWSRLKKHLSLIQEGPHRTKGGQFSQGCGTHTTVETAIAILNDSGLEWMAEEMRRCYDQDLQSQGAFIPQEAVSSGGSMSPTSSGGNMSSTSTGGNMSSTFASAGSGLDHTEWPIGLPQTANGWEQMQGVFPASLWGGVSWPVSDKISTPCFGPSHIHGCIGPAGPSVGLDALLFQSGCQCAGVFRG